MVRSWMIASSLVAACSGSPTKVEPPAPPVIADAAAPDAARPDAAPDAGVSAALAAAPAWVFRYATAQRTETWTLRMDAGQALLVVESARGTLRYTGTVTEALALDVTTGTARLALTCKHAKRALSAKCNDTKAKPIDVLDCYHPDFKEPMPFGPAPGIEYAVDATCNGYRLIAR